VAQRHLHELRQADAAVAVRRRQLTRRWPQVLPQSHRPRVAGCPSRRPACAGCAHVGGRLTFGEGSGHAARAGTPCMACPPPLIWGPPPAHTTHHTPHAHCPSLRGTLMSSASSACVSTPSPSPSHSTNSASRRDAVCPHRTASSCCTTLSTPACTRVTAAQAGQLEPHEITQHRFEVHMIANHCHPIRAVDTKCNENHACRRKYFSAVRAGEHSSALCLARMRQVVGKRPLSNR
jgi:hypothetical protein